MDIVSCLPQTNSIYFEQILPYDQGCVLLIPDPAITGNVEKGQRVLMQYYDKGNVDSVTKSIEVIQVASILSDTIENLALDSINTFKNDVLKLTSMSLLYDLNQNMTDTLDVYLRHNDNGDPMGYWAQTYVSYYIPNFNNYQVLRINTKLYDMVENYVTMKIKE